LLAAGTPPTCSRAVARRWHLYAPADQKCRRVRAARRRWTDLDGGTFVARGRPCRRCCVRLCFVSRVSFRNDVARRRAFVARHDGDSGRAQCNCKLCLRPIVYEASPCLRDNAVWASRPRGWRRLWRELWRCRLVQLRASTCPSLKPMRSGRDAHCGDASQSREH
jgi:hypothetical protein